MMIVLMVVLHNYSLPVPPFMLCSHWVLDAHPLPKCPFTLLQGMYLSCCLLKQGG